MVGLIVLGATSDRRNAPDARLEVPGDVILTWNGLRTLIDSVMAFIH